MKYLSAIFILVFLASMSYAQKSKKKGMVYDTLQTTPVSKGISVTIDFVKGPSHNHPLMAVWVEDVDSNYMTTLYVAESIGTSIFNYGTNRGGKWEPGEIRRPAALPYWGHKYGFKAGDGFYIPSVDHPVPDAITGATPKRNFIIHSIIPYSQDEQLRILFEINQSWDWNEYWTNDLYPDDEYYKTSSQPALIYEAIIDLNNKDGQYPMQVIGHSHYSGKDGNLYTDLNTFTTALEIVGKITVTIN